MTSRSSSRSSTRRNPTRRTCPRWVVWWSVAVVSHQQQSCPGVSASPPPPFSSSSVLSDVLHTLSRRGPSTLAQSVPALSVYHVPSTTTSSHRRNSSHHGNSNPTRNSAKRRTRLEETIEVSTKQLSQTQSQPARRRKRTLNVPSVDKSRLEEQMGGIYYGITSQTFHKANTTPVDGKRRPRLSDSMSEALEELKSMRLEMEMMRKEMQSFKRKMISNGDLDEDPEEVQAQARSAKRRRAKECEKLAGEIEEWAMKILDEDEEDGWKEVACNKMMRGSLNPTERTKAYLKWMKDPRGEKANNDDPNEYPCIKCISTIDAPLEDVCTYLSQESAADEYNDIVNTHKDIEEISSNTKICWSQSPQILFLKPRDFVTFCHHRWKGDGTEVMVNQAMDHPDYPPSNQEREGKACRAYALRGANIFTRCPEDPQKTKIYLVAHANPGSVPQWAAKTAVNALAPIEPFKLFHKINENVQRNKPQLRERLMKAEMVGANLPQGRSPRPAGMAQLGYACFWPNGGGVYEGTYRPLYAQQPAETNGDEDVSPNKEGHVEGESVMPKEVDEHDQSGTIGESA